MSFDQASIIYAGNSISAKRDFVVRAGTSILETRDYIVAFKRTYQLQTGAVQISGSSVRINRVYTLKPAQSLIDVKSELATLLKYAAYTLQAETSYVNVASNGINILRLKQHRSLALSLASSITGLRYNRIASIQSLALSLDSSDTSLSDFTLVDTLSPEVGIIQVRSSSTQLSVRYGLINLPLGVSSSSLHTKYNRIANLQTLPLGISSQNARLKSFIPTVFTLESGSIQVDSAELATDLRRYITHQACVLSISSGSIQFLYDRIWTLLNHTLGVGSGSIRFLFVTLASSTVQVASASMVAGRRLQAQLATSIIEVDSSNARLSNPYLVGISSAVLIPPTFSDLRFLQSGYLPNTTPTSRSFQPPNYKITKTDVLSGRTVRQIMCSRASEGILELTYNNVSDTLAENILTAYANSYGTRYGFKLPPAILTGADADLVVYIELHNSTLKWFYADKPVVESVGRGLCNLNVQLKAKVESK